MDNIQHLSYFASNDSFMGNERPYSPLGNEELIQHCRQLLKVSDWPQIVCLLREASIRNEPALSHRLTLCLAASSSANSLAGSQALPKYLN